MLNFKSTLITGLAVLIAGATSFAANGLWTDSKNATLPIDYKLQGEYIGKGTDGKAVGAQVIALGNGKFHAVVYPGGLPGAGWDGKNKSLMHGELDGKTVKLTAAEGKRQYLHNDAKLFSATRTFPPVGHQAYTATLTDGILKGDAFSLKRTERVSPTMGAKPGKGAIVLFNGSNKDEWQGGRLDKKTKLLNTDGSDIKTKRKFSNYHMHLEFLMPFKPAARSQGRGNSGFYQVDHYEMQILDSFGLEGLNNECGGIYSKKDSLVNACLPPLQWQTYDVDFTNAVAKDGKKVKNARFTARLNGILIHDDYEIPGKTGGSRRDPEGTPGPIKLQGHGNPLQYRNIWIIEK